MTVLRARIVKSTGSFQEISGADIAISPSETGQRIDFGMNAQVGAGIVPEIGAAHTTVFFARQVGWHIRDSVNNVAKAVTLRHIWIQPTEKIEICRNFMLTMT